MVSASGPALERALRDGTIHCPICQGVLRPWGTARTRVVRDGQGHTITARPRRARCSACRATHVLLPDWLLARRGYVGAVIRQALGAHAAGLGYRRIALRLRLPETTVRDWLRTVHRLAPAHATRTRPVTDAKTMPPTRAGAVVPHMAELAGQDEPRQERRRV